MHDVGTRVESDLAEEFDTPSLIELWRTAPYLHHGRAQTLRQVLSWYNASDRHGGTAHLTDEELDALAAYLRSL
jgi:cytochrome c peroxidase